MSSPNVVEISGLIAQDAGVKGGRPVVKGTGVTVMRIVGWHRMGMEPETIAAQYGHLSLAQVHAALAYYYANPAQIDADLANEAIEYDRLAQEASKGRAG
jgi:uncharacterized protein (DUF433 family)